MFQMPGRISIMHALSSDIRYSLTMRDDMSRDRGGARVDGRPRPRSWYAWMLLGLFALVITGGGTAQAVEAVPPVSPPPPAVRLSLSDAVALFLKQNLSLTREHQQSLLHRAWHF